jgi:secondary thiamine-phosphate synthase enzyme
MSWFQKTITLRVRGRGFHLVTTEILGELPELNHIQTGLLHLFITHTSAALSLNENADPTVRRDFEAYFGRSVPDNAPYFSHTLEGPDDMSAHLKSSLLGAHLSIPVSNGKPVLGTWQGIYLCEFRDRASARRVVCTLHGE